MSRNTFHNLIPTQAPRDGLVAEYLLDGNANDTAWTNNGTATNVTWATAERGYVSEVGDFNGTSSYVDFTNVTIDSFCVWIKPNIEITTSNSYSSNSYWLSSSTINTEWIRLWSVTVNATNEILTIVDWWNSNIFYWDNTAISSITTDWHFLSFIWDWTTYKLYYDWLDVWSPIIVWSPSQIRINRLWRFLTLPYFNWQIWLARIYNRALSQAEITDLYLEGLR